MNKRCTDAGFISINKFGEELCGDHVEIIPRDEKMTVAVLADGLGSGVKANILSTLTAKIISTMIANSLTLEDCVSTIAAALPVCEIRRLAYSTFTIIRIVDNSKAEIIQYDNPPVILLREGKNYDYPKTAEIIGDKTIYKTKIKLYGNDTFIALSDGAIHAGRGRSLNFGWQREDIIRFMEAVYTPELTAKTLSSLLLNKCFSLYGGEPGDDTTVCTVKIRQRQSVNLMIGPPASPADVPKMMALFFSKEGRHILCGGTTSILAAEFLGRPLVAAGRSVDPGIPPTASIEGVDLVTEGIITIHRVLEYARDYAKNNEIHTHWNYGKDGASQIARLLFEEATDINFYVGKAVNPAHDPRRGFQAPDPRRGFYAPEAGGRQEGPLPRSPSGGVYAPGPHRGFQAPGADSRAGGPLPPSPTAPPSPSSKEGAACSQDAVLRGQEPYWWAKEGAACSQGAVLRGQEPRWWEGAALPIGFSVKMRLIDDLAACLKEMGKRIKVSYF